jgi:hypothetical protein
MLVSNARGPFKERVSQIWNQRIGIAPIVPAGADAVENETDS